MKAIMTLIFALAIASSVANAVAAPITFEKDYTYQASEADSKLSCRAIAMEQVKTQLLETLGTYLTSKTQEQNAQITKDEIVTLTAGIVRAEIIEEKWDGKTYYLKARIVADPDEVLRSVDMFKRNEELRRALEDSRQKAEESLRKIEQLKRELQDTKNQSGKLVEYNVTANKLSAMNWFEKGIYFAETNNYAEAVSSFNSAVKLDPQYDLAYYNRGVAYGHLQNYSEELNSYCQAIKLNPQFGAAYFNQGIVLGKLGQHQRAIESLGKFIELEPDRPYAYILRASNYIAVRQYDAAEKDASHAAQMDPYNGDAQFIWAQSLHALSSEYKKAGQDDKANLHWMLALGKYIKAAKLQNKQAQKILTKLGINWDDVDEAKSPR